MRACACSSLDPLYYTIQLLQEGHLLLEERAASASMTWSIRSLIARKVLPKTGTKVIITQRTRSILIDKWRMGDDDMGTAVTDSFQSSRIYDTIDDGKTEE
jgi:hypothetical protein